MREIKFRGKRVDSGEWAHGCLTRYSNHMSYITVDLMENEVHQVLTATVGQYTGLKDKHGKDVYEGDIVKHNGTNLTAKANPSLRVDFIDGAFCITALKETYCWGKSGPIRNMIFEAREYGIEFEVEIIGNIHEPCDTPT